MMVLLFHFEIGDIEHGFLGVDILIERIEERLPKKLETEVVVIN